MVLDFYYILYLGLLILSPVLWGTVSDWSLGMMMVAIMLSSVLCLRRIRKKSARFYQPPGILPFCALLILMAVQLVPLPPSVVKFISPASFHLYSQSIGVVDPGKWFPVSVDIKGTLFELFRYLSYLFFYILTVQLMSDKYIFRRTIRILTFYIGILALLVIFHWLIFIKIPNPLTGPYNNRNHYAGLMEMSLPIILALFINLRPKIVYHSWREVLINTFTFQITNSYVYAGAAFIVGCISLFFTFSRGGITSFCIAMLLFYTMMPGKNWDRNNRLYLWGGIILIAFLIGSSAWLTIFNRFSVITDIHGDFTEGRLTFWANSLEVIRLSPVIGTGFGSFSMIIRPYNTLPITWPANHAHSDVLELFVEGGFIGAFIIVWFFYSYIKHAVPRYKKRRDKYAILMFIGAMTGIFSIMLHSLTDFNLHLGANGLYYFFLLGVGVSAVNTRFRGTRSASTRLEVVSRARTGWGYVLSWVSLTVLVVFFSGMIIAFLNMRYAFAYYYNKETDSQRLRQLCYIMERSVFYSPLDSFYSIFAADLYNEANKPGNANEHYKTAIFLEPSESDYLQQYAYFLGENKDIEAAEKLFRAGISNGRFNADNYMAYAGFLLSQGNQSRYFEQMRQAITLDPELLESNMDRFLDLFSEDEIAQLLPDRVAPYQYFGRYLAERNNFSAAETVYLKSLSFIENESDHRIPGYFLRVAHFLIRQKKYEDALPVLKDGSSRFPDDVKLRLKMAFCYEHLGITYRAEEEYKKILTIDPGNKTALKKLESNNGSLL